MSKPKKTPNHQSSDKNSTNLITVEDVKLHFNVRGAFNFPWQKPQKIRAVDGVNFHVRSNEILGIAGESGCGKSTIARVLMGILKPTGGRVLFHDRDIREYDQSDIRQRVQMVFQDPYTSLNPRRLVGKTIEDPLVIHRDLSESERQKIVMETLERVGLSTFHYHRYPHEFSGGQRQRIAIARALVLHPEFLILDEPTSALDVSVQAIILNLIKELQRELELACLFITHDLNLMQFLSDRMCVMYLGRVVEAGDTAQIFENPLHPYTKALIAATPQTNPERINTEAPLQGELPSAIMPPTGCHFHTRCPVKIDGVCDKITPVMQIINGRSIACHLHDINLDAPVDKAGQV